MLSPSRARLAAAGSVVATLCVGAASFVLVGTDDSTSLHTGDATTSSTAAAVPPTRPADSTTTATQAPSTSSAVPTVPTTSSEPSASTVPTTTSTAPPPPPPPPTAPPTTAAPVPRSAPFEGLGTWIDVLDWSPTYTDGKVSIEPRHVDAMADHGVDVLFVQTARFNRPEDILDPSVLDAIIDRAHGHGMSVVAWYLPTFTSPATDLRRLLAAAALDVDAVAVDIESTALADVGLRNERLVWLGAQLERQRPDVPLGAIVLPPVATEILNPALWPDFPWRSLPDVYDVVLPMGYWTNRTPESGWLDGERYTTRNVELVRELTDAPAMRVHAVGGIAAPATVAQVQGMVRACQALRLIGCPMYDEATMRPELWPPLLPLSTP